ncbi:MAG: glycosyltransferase [Veillonella sp.]|nr:glycosyltransferase [Veillonella sp.]
MKKEIIIVTISLGNDGAERILTELARQWVHDGHHITVIQTSPNRYGNEYALEEGIEQIEIHTTSSNKVIRFMQEIKELIKILKTRPNATCLSFLSASSFILAISSWFIKNRIVFSERNNPRKVPIGWHQQALRNFAFRFADALVFQTEDARSYFPKSVQNRGVIIPNPINGKLPPPIEGEREKTIVTACRLHPQKNLPMDELRAQIKSLNLENRILLPGFASNILEKVAPCSMFVSSSDFEGISNSMLEALGMGLPVVVTDCPVGGARMVIKSGENGILVPVGDTQAMYEAMRSVLKDPALAAKLSQNAIKVRDEFPLWKIAKRWLEVL